MPDARNIPSVHVLLQNSQIRELIEEVQDEQTLTNIVRTETDKLRNAVLNGMALDSKEEAEQMIIQHAGQQVRRFFAERLHSVINATGTILHTNLGRAPLGPDAVKKVVEAASGYSNLEYNVETGRRGSRHDILEDLLCEVTGAEAAMAVNNNAAAVYLVLRALTAEREVVVSRGQLVEIGGSFRVSSIMEESGAVLKEVGTTNKTHPYDYEGAVNERTAMLMKVHTSNFSMHGFTSDVSTKEMSRIGKDHDLLVYEDLGSGALYDFRTHGIGEEPTVKEALEAGADLVSFSGDKLLGGPQAGIIAGRKDLIDRLKKHQLARVLRCDKMTLAALEATIKAYLPGQSGKENIPAVHMLLMENEELEARADLFLNECRLQTWTLAKTVDESKVGGGTMPDVTLPTTAVRLNTETITAEQAARALRLKNGRPVIARVSKEQLLFDMRTLQDADIMEIAVFLMELEKEGLGV